MQERVRFEQGDATAIPFKAASFDGAYSMNVSMNIADKPAFYREIRRVLTPGGWLLLSEIAARDRRPLDYPTPWASSARTSFLSTPDETEAGLRDSGFDLLHVRDTTDAALAFGARSRAIVERGGKPPHRGVQLIHGDIAKEAMANSARALQDGRAIAIAILGRRR
jgi:SAM-dependent methyltransferase